MSLKTCPAWVEQGNSGKLRQCRNKLAYETDQGTLCRKHAVEWAKEWDKIHGKSFERYLTIQVNEYDFTLRKELRR